MIEVYRKEEYRSNPYVNDDYDMVQMTLRMPKSSWRLLKKLLKESRFLTLKDDISDVEICEKYGIKGDYE